MSLEYRFVGPPGTGKSTELARRANLAAGQFGAENVLICSLTRAAAAEIGSKDTHIPPRNVGTLHSFAYRSCEPPGIADAPKNVKRWNEWVTEAGHPYLRISSTQPDADENAIEGAWGGEGVGDRYYGTYQVARNRMEGIESLSEPVQHFAELWERWKSEEGLMDFTEMLEYCLREVDCAPGNPAVIFMDEAQDTSLLGMRLLRKWGARADYFVIFGDPLQNLYAWAGTDPEAFTTPDVPDAQKRVLSQSYRVPRAVHAHALVWIEPLKQQLEEQLGKRIEYHPRDAEGCVRRLGSAHFRYPEPIVNDLEEQIDRGRTCMVLGACSHMLENTIAVLRRRGIPFHNPWRAKRGDWNPLGKRNGVSAKERLLAYLRLSPEAWDEPALWNHIELWAWVEVLEAQDLLPRGAKKELEKRAKDPQQNRERPDLEQLQKWLGEATGDALLGSGETDADWFEEHLLDTKRKSLEFPINVLRQRGAEALKSRPRVIIGTIHSLKGSETDVVYVLPDLSDSGMQEWCRDGSGRDGIFRAFYVAMTRAREELVLCSAAGPNYVRL